ncbi:MAG: flagellar M-ring protein FliF [Marinobacter sp.]|nr:flagellar M-ring protein FliF [Marinobacter sp.]
MASLPAETAKVPATTVDEKEAKGVTPNLLFGFERLSLIRQIALMVGLAASVALGISVVLWAQEPAYQPILGDLSSYNPQDVTEVLDQANIKYRMDPRSGALLVAAGDVYNARLRLASAGVTDSRMIGFELLDQDRGLGTSQFMETISYRRGLEGELARTITSMRNVRSARVHLAIPQRSVFIRDARSPTASVFLDVLAGRRLSEEQIAAIVNLVAGSIPELQKEHVTVVDQAGNLLTGREDTSHRRQMQDQYEYTARMEERMTRRVAAIVEPLVGGGRFRAEVSADLDFSSVEQAEELFNPDQRAVRSERELNEQRRAGTTGGIPGALTNQPPGQATAPEVAGQGDANGAGPAMDVRSESTRNFEMDRTISFIRQQQGRVQRLTVAVALDDKRVVNPETGAVRFEPWTEAELQRVTLLIRDAVGFSAARGDSVTVMNTAFAPVEAFDFTEPGFWQQPWFWDLMKQVLAGIVILILVFALVRPALKNISGANRQDGDELLAGAGDGGAVALPGPDGFADLGAALGGDELLLPGGSDSYDRQLNALRGLIAEDPARVANLVRQWVNADE